MNAHLLLEDGTTFEGIAEHGSADVAGEVVLNTAVVGYQEILTDPANAGKIVALTYPLIGNYGTAPRFDESGRPWAHALVFRERSRITSNWQAEGSLEEFAGRHGMLTLREVDTRTLAIRIRDHGEMYGLITCEGVARGDALRRLEEAKGGRRRDFISRVSTPEIQQVSDGGVGPKVAVLDLGMMRGFTNQLVAMGCTVTLLPYRTSAADILARGFDGLVVSSGPEDDEAVAGIAEQVAGALGRLPVLGIALGHEIIALALGGKLRRLKVGHHGLNYPVRSPESFKGEITVQNHSFVVEEESLEQQPDVRVTLRNVNDETVEEMESERLGILSAQYYPVRPSPGVIHGLFTRFVDMMAEAKRS